MLDEVANDESEQRNHNHMLMSYQIPRKSGKKDSVTGEDRQLLEDIRGTTIRIPDFNSKMSDQASTFRKKRQSYLAHEVNNLLANDQAQLNRSLSGGSLQVESKPPKIPSCNDSDNLHFSDLPISEQIDNNENDRLMIATQKPQVSNHNQLNLLSSRDRDIIAGPEQLDQPSKPIASNLQRGKGKKGIIQKS